MSAAVVACVLIAVQPAASSAVAETTDAEVASAVARECARSIGRGQILSVDSSSLDSGGSTVIVDGQTFAVGPAGWQHSGADALASAVFDSGGWLWAAYDVDYPAIADRLVEQAIASPDPGDDATHTQLLDTGWAESAMSRRLGTVVCAYDKTSDVRLLPIMTSLVAGLSGPRYYGPPYRQVHNHGLFANLAIFDAGLVVSEATWVDFAVGRIEAEAPLVFGDCGMMGEQASGYQVLNYQLWQEASSAIEGHGSGTTALLSQAAVAIGALAAPDGHIEPIGDGFGSFDASAFPYLGSLWCPTESGQLRASGWAAAQMITSYGASHHIVRFGPAPTMHGHDDRGSMTWWVDVSGVQTQVLSDRGVFDKSDRLRLEQESAAGNHSVLEIGRMALDRVVSATRHVYANDSYSYTLVSGTERKRTRSITFWSGSPVVSVVDKIQPPNSSRRFYIQHWQLASGWVPSGTNSATKGPLTLTITCLVNGVRHPLVAKSASENMGFRQGVPAWDMQCRAQAQAPMRISTTLRLTG
ncbi:unannotated protein [freshwater metagenome]|uniref:Unannotated protein n=1 Tax=freshwater metagenome TaxID=449393 RepID=A0A6J7GYJ8_9ZZZZ